MNSLHLPESRTTVFLMLEFQALTEEHRKTMVLMDRHQTLPPMIQ